MMSITASSSPMKLVSERQTLQPRIDSCYLSWKFMCLGRRRLVGLFDEGNSCPHFTQSPVSKKLAFMKFFLLADHSQFAIYLPKADTTSRICGLLEKLDYIFGFHKTGSQVGCRWASAIYTWRTNHFTIRNNTKTTIVAYGDLIHNSTMHNT